MTATAVASFVVAVGGIGFGAQRLTDRRSWPERLALALPVGLGLWPMEVLALRLLHLPFDWRLAAALGLAGVALGVADRRAAPPLARSRLGAMAAAASVAGALAAVMYWGATRYPHLEDDDPWQHAVAARWVALQRTTVQPDPPISLVLEPYPPHYAALMGVLHQVDPDLKNLLKFFNALMVGLSALGAFLAFEALSGSFVKALAAAALLSVSPSYMSHFIWSQTLAIPVFFAAVWALAAVGSSGRWWAGARSWLALLLVWSATVTQPSSAAVFALLLVVAVAVRAAAAGARGEPLPRAEMAAIGAAGLASLATWLLLMRRQLHQYASQPEAFRGGQRADTSGGLIYGLRDILFEYGQKIDQGTGLGWATATLAVIALVALAARWRRDPPFDRATRLVIAAWASIGILGIEGNALPWKLFPHRFWVFLAIPVAYLAAEGADALASMASRGRARAGVLIAAVGIAFGTNLGPRLALQTGAWPPGAGWVDPDQFAAWIETAAYLPRWTRVFAPCFRDDYLIGLNLEAEPWDPVLQDLRQRLPSTDGRELATVMAARGYPYLVLDVSCVQKLGLDAARALDASVRASGRFQVEAQAPGFAVFRLLPQR